MEPGTGAGPAGADGRAVGGGAGNGRSGQRSVTRTATAADGEPVEGKELLKKAAGQGEKA
jgi:hypothetical protein